MRTEKFPLVSIIIPTMNRQDDLLRLLQSIEKSSYKNIEIFIVNNGSELPFNKYKKYKTNVIENHSNKGLAFARNKGATKSHGKYILFIDDDNVMEKNTIGDLVEALFKNKDLLAVGPLTYYLKNPKKIWFLGSKINLWTTIPYFYNKVENERLRSKKIFLVENLHNCFMLEKEKGELAGWFDEKLYMNGTEFDLFQRIRKKNGDKFCGTVLAALDYHDVPEYSSDIVRSLGFANPLRAYYFQRNRGIFMNRYGNFIQKLSLFILFYPLFFLGYGLLFLAKRRMDLLKAHFRGTISGYYYLFNPLQ